MSSTTTSRLRLLHPRGSAAAVIAAVAAIVLLPASPAAAHHGWDGFDTDHLVYVAGDVSSDGRWGEPHSYFDVTLDSDLPADTPDLTIPDELQDPQDSIRVESALSYRGQRQALEVIIAPPAWSGRWGLDRPLAVQERFQAVGYVNRSDDRLFRPVAFWYGDNKVPVNQVLGNTLPVRAPLPDPAGAPSAPAPAAAPSPLDPLELPAPSTASSAPESDAQATSEEGSEAVGVWTAFGIAVIAAAAGGFLYLRSRTRRD